MAELRTISHGDATRCDLKLGHQDPIENLAAHGLTEKYNPLIGQDEEQVKLMDEVCIVVDENDNPIGTASKKDCKRSLPRLR